jgi:SPP1 family predicted phage head-tail adaptor
MSAKLPIGARRQFLTLAAPVAAPDDNGGATTTFAPVASFWARVSPRAQATIFRNDEQGRNVTHDIYFRAWPGLTGDMRLFQGARTFQILSFDDFDEKGATTRAQCEEVTP